MTPKQKTASRERITWPVHQPISWPLHQLMISHCLRPHLKAKPRYKKSGKCWTQRRVSEAQLPWKPAPALLSDLQSRETWKPITFPRAIRLSVTCLHWKGGERRFNQGPRNSGRDCLKRLPERRKWLLRNQKLGIITLGMIRAENRLYQFVGQSITKRYRRSQ